MTSASCGKERPSLPVLTGTLSISKHEAHSSLRYGSKASEVPILACGPAISSPRDGATTKSPVVPQRHACLSPK
jgi:hypothetical protein